MDKSLETTRRTFVKGAAAAAALGTLAAAAPAALADEKPAEGADSAASEAPAAGGLKDGLWMGQAMGHRDKTTVQIAVSGGAITSMKVLRCDDTVGIGSVAAPMMCARIAENQNLDVDVVSGATMTSWAVRNALEEAITAAGGNPDDYHKGTPAVEQGADAEEDVDVVVVGAGTAGLVAATRLLEAGKTVCVIEKHDIAGGSGCMTYSGVVAIGSDMQEAWKLGQHDADDVNFSIDARVNLIKSYSGLADDAQLPYIRAQYEVSAPMVNWMQSIGLGFVTMGSTYFAEPVLSPGPYMGGSGIAMNYLAQRIEALGSPIHYGASVTELIQGEDGAVAGVKATCKDGSALTVNAKAVCMATGGFAANHDMLAEYYPDYADAAWACCSASTGEGMEMAVKAGAVLECMGRQLGAFNSTTPDAAGTRFELAFLHYFAPGMMVNGNGDEFGQGSLNHAFMGKAVIDPSNGGRFFHVTDHAGATTLAKYDTWAACTDYACLFDRGDIVHYDTVEEAAEALELPDLRATLDSHNQHALAGEQDEFGRKPTFINDNDGVWLVSCMPTFYLTTGGIRIDTSARVLDEADAPIPGLYAAGDICGSIEEKDGVGYSGGFEAALTYGFIMAETVEQELQ